MGPQLGWSPHRSGTVSPVLEAAAGVGHPGVEGEDINSDHAWLLEAGWWLGVVGSTESQRDQMTYPRPHVQLTGSRSRST